MSTRKLSRSPEGRPLLDALGLSGFENVGDGFYQSSLELYERRSSK